MHHAGQIKHQFINKIRKNKQIIVRQEQLINSLK